MAHNLFRFSFFFVIAPGPPASALARGHRAIFHFRHWETFQTATVGESTITDGLALDTLFAEYLGFKSRCTTSLGNFPFWLITNTEPLHPPKSRKFLDLEKSATLK